MILCLQIDKLSLALKGISPLINLYKKNDFTFPDKVIQWLDDTEQTMAQLRFPEGAELSTLRGDILKVKDEGYGKGIPPPKRSAVQKSTNERAASSLQRAQEIIVSRLLKAEETLEQFENKLAEGVMALMLEIELPSQGGNNQIWINRIWDLLRQQPSTKALVLYISASLSPVDRYYILDKTINQVLSQELVPPDFG